MQRELAGFFRNLRIKWHFINQRDGRSDMEREFYHRSDWNPNKACKEVENMNHIIAVGQYTVQSCPVVHE